MQVLIQFSFSRPLPMRSETDSHNKLRLTVDLCITEYQVAGFPRKILTVPYLRERVNEVIGIVAGKICGPDAKTGDKTSI